MSELFMEYLKDIYSAEKQQLECLPRFISKLENINLKELLERNLERTKVHEKRIESIFELLKDNFHLHSDLVMEELLCRINKLLKYSDNNKILDASFISSMQGIVYYEIATYGMLRSLAATLNYHPEIISLLIQTLDDENRFELELENLAKEAVFKKVKQFSIAV